MQYSYGPPQLPVWVVSSCVPPHDRRAARIGSGYPWNHFHDMCAHVGLTEFHFTYVSSQSHPPAWHWATKSEGIKKGYPLHHDKYVKNSLLLQELDYFYTELREHRPEVVITLGDLALWALTGEFSSAKWRGSQLKAMPIDCKVISLQDPLQLEKNWSWHDAMLRDLQRVVQEAIPAGRSLVDRQEKHIIWPSYEEAKNYLTTLASELDNATDPIFIANDIETKAGVIYCNGFAYKDREAICIPFHSTERPNFYDALQDLNLKTLQHYIYSHPRAILVGQNYNYDRTYLFNELLVWPRTIHDTMTAQHTLLPGTPKSLDYLASFYCAGHAYWKDERKEAAATGDESIEWHYNCKDCIATLEIIKKQLDVLERRKLEDQYDLMMKVSEPLLLLQLDGVRVDLSNREILANELNSEQEKLKQEIEFLSLGYITNPLSSQQCMEFFYDVCRLKEYKNRKTGKRTGNAASLAALGSRDILFSPIVDKILRFRTFNVLRANTVEAALGPDNRMYCSYNVTGTETFRLSSSKDVYGRGCNNQNITADSQGINLRKLFLPEKDFCWVSMDLDRADLQVVAWDAKAITLKRSLAQGEDTWLLEAAEMLDKEPSEVVYAERKAMKGRLHATNYRGKPRTLAMQFGTSIQEAAALQEKWFSRHPEIKEWQEKIEHQIRTTRRLSNAFGFEWTIKDRIQNNTLSQALAWIPQSTIAIVCHITMIRLYERYAKYRNEFRFTLQLHDELGFQVHNSLLAEILEEIQEKHARVTIPYDDPLVIPVGFKVGPNWGEVEDYINEST